MATRKKAPKRVDRRKTMSTRITPETRAQLDAAAVQSGRSLAQEIEFRLEQSFLLEAAEQRERQSIEEAFGGRGRYLFLKMISAAADRVEWDMEKPVYKDPIAWTMFQAATVRLFDELAPTELKGMVGLLHIAAIEEAKALGRDIAELTLANVKIAAYSVALKKLGVDPDSIDTGSE